MLLFFFEMAVKYNFFDASLGAIDLIKFLCDLLDDLVAFEVVWGSTKQQIQKFR
jgi:hypothetical protein